MLSVTQMFDFSENLALVKSVEAATKIYKDECMYCFDNPETETGIFVSLKTFYGYCQHHLDVLFNKIPQLFLHYKKTKLLDDKPVAKVTKLAIGGEHGFQVNKQFQYHEQYTLYIMPDKLEYNISETQLPSHLTQCIKDVIAAIPALKATEIDMKSLEWDGEQRQITKHAYTLIQIPQSEIPNFPIDLTKSNLKCRDCDVTENLWLNLSDGAIVCGRRNFDGSGGNNHGIEHWKKTQYPLAVKIGTIDGESMSADVFSYHEDDMVLDPNLESHLAHLGIDMSKLNKTGKTMAQLEIEMNETYRNEWNSIQELGKKLIPVFGPGLTGIYNLGNTCYISSILQIVMSLPRFQQSYYQNYESNMIKENFGESFAGINFNNHTNPCDNFNIQFGKIAFGLLSGRYSHEPPMINADSHCQNEEALFEVDGIKPRSFNQLVKKTHPEFRTDHQQDAHECLIHLLQLCEQSFVNNSKDSSHNNRKHCDNDSNDMKINELIANPANTFKFVVQERWECPETHKVKYIDRIENYLSLAIPLEKLMPVDNPDSASLIENGKTTENNLVADSTKIESDNMDGDHENPNNNNNNNNASLEEGTSLDTSPKMKGNDMCVTKPTKHKIEFSQLLSTYFEPEHVTGFKDPKCGNEMVKTLKLKSLPPYLVFHIKRYSIMPNPVTGIYEPIKLDVSLDNVPTLLDLSSHKLSEEDLLKCLEYLDHTDDLKPSASCSKTTNNAIPFPEAFENITPSVLDMGFTLTQLTNAWRVLIKSKSTSLNLTMAPELPTLETVINWIMEHPYESLQEEEINYKASNNFDENSKNNLQGKSLYTKAITDTDHPHVASIMALGFERAQAIIALQQTQNDIERAVDWLFNNPDVKGEVAEAQLANHFDPSVANSSTSNHSHEQKNKDSNLRQNKDETLLIKALVSENEKSIQATGDTSQYRLRGIVSHIGSNLACGHYVCHVKKRIPLNSLPKELKNGVTIDNIEPDNEHWVIFNDSKVALSENPPLNLAYLYFYERVYQ